MKALPRWWNALAFAALATGCSSHAASSTLDPDPGDITPPQTTDPPTDPGTSPGTTPGTDPGSGPGTNPGPQQVCAAGNAATPAPGSALFTLETGAGALDLRSDVAFDAAGDVFYTRPAAVGFMMTKYTAAGAVVYSVPFGEVVAADAAGNAYIAGAFTAPIDLGLGTVMPASDDDVFVAKLAPDGKPLFVRALGLCADDGVRAIAVAGDGRIAVSGDMMGTVVLDTKGALLMSRDFAGDVAFDSTGALVVAGQFSGAIDFGGGAGFTTTGPDDIDGFVVKLDRSGAAVWSDQFGDAALPVTLAPDGGMISTPTRQLAAAVAIGPNDEIVIAGQFDDDARLFGADFVANFVSVASVPLRSGGFVVTLDASGAMKRTAVRLGLDGYRDVAVDTAGNVIVTGMELADTAPPFRFALLDKIDPTGAVVFERTNTIGAGHAVAVDACGDIAWSASLRTGGPDQPLTAELVKLAP